jgi:hypothetical protein
MAHSLPRLSCGCLGPHVTTACHLPPANRPPHRPRQYSAAPPARRRLVGCSIVACEFPAQAPADRSASWAGLFRADRGRCPHARQQRNQIDGLGRFVHIRTALLWSRPLRRQIRRDPAPRKPAVLVLLRLASGRVFKVHGKSPFGEIPQVAKGSADWAS